MTDLDKTRSEPIEQLFDFLDDTRAVMLGLDQPGQSMQPMAPQVDDDRHAIWFFAKRDSELGKAINGQAAARARICLISGDHDYHACISGSIGEDANSAVIDDFWSPVVAAWFDEGKQDPNLMMLRFDPGEADIWASSGSVVRFAWEIALANLGSDEPELGETRHVVFPLAAPRSEAAE